MNQLFAVTAGLALTLALWTLGRKPFQTLFRDNSEGIYSRFPLAQSSLVQDKNFGSHNKNAGELAKNQTWQLPKTARERIDLRKQLSAAISADPEKRLQAIHIAELWGHPSVLPILKRGLRDSDSRVVCAAAKAIEKYRGSGSPAKSLQTTGRPPRNVALMR